MAAVTPQVGSEGAGDTLTAIPRQLPDGAVALGIAVEVEQYFIGRDASAREVLMDAAGAAFALCGATRQTSRKQAVAAFGKRLALFAGLLLTAAIATGALAHAALGYARRAAIFPDLVRFQSGLDLYFAAPQGADLDLERPPAIGLADTHSDTERVNHRAALLGDLSHAQTPGLRLEEPEPVGVVFYVTSMRLE